MSASRVRINVGERFAMLVVVAPTTPSEDGKSRWIVRCDCGVEKSIRGRDFVSGRTLSCGCRRRASAAICGRLAFTTHGGSGTPEHSVWAGMISRCTSPRDRNFSRYGGAGITVCDRWRKFENFRADMGARLVGMTLDRIDVNGNYEPRNCRWATSTEQNRNKGNNRIVTYQGMQMTLAEAAERAGISYHSALRRLKRFGHVPDAPKQAGGAV